MSKRFGARCLVLVGLVCSFAASASAAPLLYKVVQEDSEIEATFRVGYDVDVSLDPLNAFPQSGDLVGTSTTFPSGLSRVIADVGLPDGFNDGANGITFSQLSIITNNLPGELTSVGLISVPLSLTGEPTQAIAFFASVSNFSIVLNAPFTSTTFTPSVNPNEWLWTGVGNVTISGTLKPHVEIPTVQTIDFPDTPFSQVLDVPLLGTFSGDNTSTKIQVGIPINTLHNLNLGLPAIDQNLDIGGLISPLLAGLITTSFHLDTLVLGDISTSVVYVNDTQPIPEPGTAPLVGLGLVGLAIRRRRASR